MLLKCLLNQFIQEKKPELKNNMLQKYYQTILFLRCWYILKFCLKVADGETANSSNTNNNTNTNSWIHSGSPFLWFQQKHLHAYIWQMLSFKATCIAFKVYITSVHVFPGNWTHAPGGASSIWMNGSVRKDQPNVKVLSSTVQMDIQTGVCFSTSGDAGPGTTPGFSFCHQ